MIIKYIFRQVIKKKRINKKKVNIIYTIIWNDMCNLYDELSK